MGTGLVTVGAVALASCVDDPRPIPPPGAREPAERSSALGVFQGEPRDQDPAAGFVPYVLQLGARARARS